MQKCIKLILKYITFLHFKMCFRDGCKVIPNYNYEGEMKGIYCGTHRLEGMVDVKHTRCISDGCKVQPYYNYEGKKKGLYCGAHRLEGMVDVKHNRCISDGCKVIPNYNYEGEMKGLYCGTHRLEGMVDVKHNRCISDGCKVRSIYNYEGKKKGIYCGTHRLEGMMDVKNNRCKTYLCFTRVSEKYDGYCLYCYMNLFPDKPVSRNYKTKEYSVVEYIKAKFPDLYWIADKIISNGCSKRRPDLLLDLEYQILIIEIDENQHIDYGCSCENKRLMEISLDLGNRPVVFIRFNPDAYLKNEEKISSCWGLNKKGICQVKNSKKIEWTHRLNVLEEHIQYWIQPENKTDKTIEVIHLVYDI